MKETGQGAAGHKEIERESITTAANHSYWFLYQLDYRHKLPVSRVQATSPTKLRETTIGGSQPDKRKVKQSVRSSRSRHLRGFFCTNLVMLD